LHYGVVLNVYVSSQHAKNGQLFYNKGKDLIASMVVMGDVDLCVVSFEQAPCGIGLWLSKMNDELHNRFCMVIAQNGFKKSVFWNAKRNFQMNFASLVEVARTNLEVLLSWASLTLCP
jgi:hypothetical protein